MNRKDLDALNELYLSVYEEEQLNENAYSDLIKRGYSPSAANQMVQRNKNVEARGGGLGQIGAGMIRLIGSKEARKQLKDTDTADRRREQTALKRTNDPNWKPGQPPVKPVPPEKKPLTGIAPVSRDTSGSSSSSSSSNVRPAPPKPSGPVLSKKNGVEGTGVGANFKARAFSAAEKSRYSSVAARNSASSAAPKPATEKSPQGYSVGTTAGGTKFERRTPTRQEMDAAKRAGGGEAGVKAAVASNQPTTGPANATIDKASVEASKAAFKPAPTPARNGFGASTAGANAAASVSSATAPALPGQNSINNKKPTTQMSSYEWPSAKTIRDIAGAYSSIYEAKKKVDQDQDGDNDFADVRVARMIASGVPKAKAIAMVKDKSYNEEVELWVNELLEEGYDLSEYTWEDMFEIYEATAMAKRGYDETEIRNKIAKSTGGGTFADKATELENRPTFGNKSKKAAREKLARTQRGDFRRTTSSNPGLHGYAYKSNDPAVKAKQAARGAQRGVLTPNEKKELNREAYAAYEFVASYLLENNFAATVNDANVIINNMSENWFESIMEDVRGVSYNPNPIGNAIRAGAGLLKNTMNRPSVQGAIKTGSQMLQKSVPSGGYSTREGDGKPRETPLWDGPSKPTPTTPTKPQTKKQPPMRDEPLW